MSEQNTFVRAIEPSEKDKFVDFLTHTLTDDPMFVYIYPNRKKRAKFLRRFIELDTKYTINEGTAYVIENEGAEKYLGAVAWLGPDADYDEWIFLFHILISCKFSKLIPTIRFLWDVEAHAPKGRHWYLPSLAVHPDYYGKGLGKKLMDHTLEIIDKTGEPTYLESSNPKNHSFYHRLGYRKDHEIVLDGDTTITTMIRDPR